MNKCTFGKCGYLGVGPRGLCWDHYHLMLRYVDWAVKFLKTYSPESLAESK